MTQILDSYGQPCDEAYRGVMSHYQGLARADERSGPCDDDCETTAPFIDGMPDGTHPDEFLSRPLNLDSDNYAAREYRQHLKDQELLERLYESDMDTMMHQRRKRAKRGSIG